MDHWNDLNCDLTVKAVARAWPRPSPGSPSVSLWRSQKQGQLSTSAMRQMIDGLVRDASARGLVPPQTSAHTLRHTFARNYLASIPATWSGWQRCSGIPPSIPRGSI